MGPGLGLLTRPPFLLQVSQFLWNHGDIAFAPLGRLLLENFKLEGAHVSNPGWPGGGGAPHFPSGWALGRVSLTRTFYTEPL